jgi:hypothetical protein
MRRKNEIHLILEGSPSLMMMPILPMGAMVAVAGVSTFFGLEGDLHLYEIRSKTNEHILDHLAKAG